MTKTALWPVYCRYAPVQEQGHGTDDSGWRKTILAMRLTILFIGLSLITAHAEVVGQNISISGNSLTLRKLFKTIEHQTGYKVLGNKDILWNAKPFSIHQSIIPLQKLLNLMADAQSLDYSIEGKTIVVFRKTDASKNTGSALSGSGFELPPVSVKIHITDANGAPLSGAAVINTRTKNSGMTDDSGTISLNIQAGDIIQISYIGFESKSITVTGTATDITISLTATVSMLDETIVQAYGTTSRRLNTGNIAKVTADEIGRQPVGNPLAALEGKVPGLIITQSTGLPGGAIKVEVRGRTAIDRNITDDQPLFVIDGVPFGANNAWLSKLSSALGIPSSIYTESSQGGTSPFNSINPQDIESIEVLKDADATAIYGSRGANGVVFITTKKGRSGKGQVNLNLYSGFSTATKRLSMMNTRQYVNMRKQAFANDQVTPTPANAYDFMVWDTTRYTDFDNLFTNGTAHTTDAQLSLSGGSTSTHYLIGGSYRRETTVIHGDYAAKRGATHFNLNHQSTDNRFKMQLSGMYSVNNNDLPSSDPRAGFNRLPNIPVYDNEGKLAWGEKGYNSSNPLTILFRNYWSSAKALQSNLLLSYEISKGIDLRVSAGYNSNILSERTKSPGTTQNPANATISRLANFSSNNFESWIIEPQAEYTGKLFKGTFKVLGGLTWQNIVNNGSSVTASGYGSDELMYSLNAATQFSATNWSSQYLYAATFGRVNYNWQNKYILNLTARRDGSSRFGTGSQYANFGAAGAAWIFTNEEVFRNKVPLLSFGKLRGSYGLTGNDKITDYQFLDTWQSVPTTYDGLAGLYPDKLFNPNYRWEKTVKAELGLDLGFINDRLLLSAVYYNNRSSNQLVQYQLPAITGFTNVIANLPASVENAGFELTFTATILKKKTISWSSSANITLPRNRLLSFPGLAASPYANRYVEKQPLNVIYGFRYLGVNPQTGVYDFEDFDKNSIYDERDYQVLDHTDPVMYGGWQNSLRIGHFELDLLFSFRKQTGRSYIASIDNSPGARANLPAEMTDVWEKPGDQVTIQQFSNNNTAARTAWSRYKSYSNGIYTDASFIRLKNASLSYQVNAPWLSKILVNNCRVYIQGQNLFTITKYKVTDPETQYLGRTPPLVTLTAGLNITFK
jgi:TonB-linked SusC/RagA family outer membrane protein